MSDRDDVLEQNVSTLLEAGGEPPHLAPAARERMRAELVAKFATAPAQRRERSPLAAVGIGLAAAAALAMVIGHFVGRGSTGVVAARRAVPDQLGDGSTYLVAPGAKVTELGPRHVRVEGEALLDVVPGKGTFTVETAQGRIEVLGTKFFVDGEHDRTLTAVVRGSVKLATDSGSVTLHAGEQAIAEHGRAPVRSPAPRLSHLASWAQEARHRTEHDTEPVHHGTLFARDPGVRSHPPWGAEYPLPIAKLGIDVVVEDQVARVALDQTFRNSSDQDLEGVYRFAIPSDAALQRLAMYVDGKLMESAVVERMRARRIYEELVYRRVDPALLEWAGTGRLSLRVYPIPAHQDKRLMLAYTQSLPKLYSDWTLSIPLPEIDQPVGEVEVAMRVKGCANCELASPSHKIEVTHDGDDAIVRYRHAADKIGDSFVLHVRDARGKPTLATDEQGGERYVMVRAPAELGGKAREYRPRTWVILDDVSASRSALELRAQADLVDAFLGELDENDRVAVVAFDVEARQKLAATRVLDVDRRAVRQALAKEGGVGATDFAVALDAAMHALDGVSPDDAMIVYLGDGVITSGSQKLDELRARIAGKAHFVGVGVGDGPDTQTLHGLADATGGYAATFDLSDDLSWRAFDLVAALHTSRVTGLEARLVDASGKLVPATLYLASPQLADGEEVEAVAKLAGDGVPAALELTGSLDGQPWQRRVALPAPHAHAGYLPRLWAQRHIAARLLAKHEAIAPDQREARDEAIRKEVVALGKKYFLLSRHTSLLVLENDDMYARYDVAKGAGDTWAPYAMPATVPVVKLAAAQVAPDIAPDAELIRQPLEVFYSYPQYLGGLDEGEFGWRGRDTWWQGNDIAGAFAGPVSVTTLPTGASVSFDAQLVSREGMLGNLRTVDTPVAPPPPPASQPMQEHLAEAKPDDNKAFDRNEEQTVDRSQLAQQQAFATVGAGGEVAGGLIGGFDDRRVAGTGTGFGFGRGSRASAFAGRWGNAMPYANRLTYPADGAFDDLTAFVPALVRDDADSWRALLRAGEGQHSMDDAAKSLLAAARRALPAGVYRWDDLEIVVDDAHRFGWRRTTPHGLAETASFDGKSLTRRYAELGIDAVRSVGDDDIALSLAYFPLWIAEPAHYAKYFDVSAKGREVTLSRSTSGRAKTVLVLRFDDHSRLVQIVDATGRVLVDVTWTIGPSSVRIGDSDVAVGFTAQPVTDATQWAHAGTQPGIAVELPGRLVAFERDRVKAETPGTPTWRHAQRQLMLALAATQDRAALYAAYDELRTHGGVELGDLALASSGLATATTDAQLDKALAPVREQPIARYIAAYRAWGKSARPEQLEPKTRDGLVGALWSVRAAVAYVQRGNGKQAVAEITALGDRAPELRLAATTLISQYGDPADAKRLWDAVAIGEYRNVARAAAAQTLSQRGQYDAAAEAIAQLVDDLDLGARPANLEQFAYAFSASRRGPAGWQLVRRHWRERVLAGTSYEHVMALLAAAPQDPEVMPVLARAAELAGDDPARKLAVALIAINVGRSAWAESIARPLLASHPTRELYMLVADLEQQQGKLADALGDLEAAQNLDTDERVPLQTLRGELSRIINVAGQLAQQAAGPARKQAIDRALRWADSWRAIDAGNPSIDAQVGELLLDAGDTAGAWRQLSTVIERDPWSSAGYMTVAETFERQGKVEEALPYWQQAIIIDQTNPTPRLRKAQALIALGKTAEGDALLAEISSRTWHDVWSSVVYQAKDLLERGKRR